MSNEVKTQEEGIPKFGKLLIVLFLAVVLSLMRFTIKTIIEARRSDRPTVHEVHPQMEPAE